MPSQPTLSQEQGSTNKEQRPQVFFSILCYSIEEIIKKVEQKGQDLQWLQELYNYKT